MYTISLASLVGFVLGINCFSVNRVEVMTVDTSISMRVGEDCFDDTHKHVKPDNNPEILNLKDLEDSTKINQIDFDIYDREDFVITYVYVVHADKAGTVESIDLSSASNHWSKDIVDRAARRIKFDVARKDGEAIDCVYYVRFEFRRHK